MTKDNKTQKFQKKPNQKYIYISKMILNDYIYIYI